jgi:hypothetical protein
MARQAAWSPQLAQLLYCTSSELSQLTAARCFVLGFPQAQLPSPHAGGSAGGNQCSLPTGAAAQHCCRGAGRLSTELSNRLLGALEVQADVMARRLLRQ